MQVCTSGSILCLAMFCSCSVGPFDLDVLLKLLNMRLLKNKNKATTTKSQLISVSVVGDE